jgi:hypothetical protein
MNLEIDEDVKAVMEFMQKNVAATKLVNVAKAAASLAPIIWGEYNAEALNILSLRESPPIV